MSSSLPASVVRVAVVLCAHNGARFIEEQLNSLETQTRPVDEIIVYDWASTDATADIVERWRNTTRDRAVMTSLRRMKSAPGPARSFLHALGDVSHRKDLDLIFLCDQDDIWMSHKVATFLDLFATEGFDLAFSDAMVLQEDGSTLATFYGTGSPYRRPSGRTDESVLLTNPAVGMTMCIRREWLARVAECLNLYWIMHDWALMQLCWLTNGRLRFVDVPLVLYRQHDRNALGAAVSRSVMSRARKVGAHVRSIREQLISIGVASEALGDAVAMRVPRLHGRVEQARVVWHSTLLTAKYRLLLSAALLLH